MTETHYRGHRFEVTGKEIRVKSPSGRLLGRATSFARARAIVKRSLRVAGTTTKAW